jgi:hypothetical protein
MVQPAAIEVMNENTRLKLVDLNFLDHAGLRQMGNGRQKTTTTSLFSPSVGKLDSLETKIP